MTGQETSKDQLRQQIGEVLEDEERLQLRQQQLLAAARLIARARFLRGAETNCSQQVAVKSEDNEISSKKDNVMGESRSKAIVKSNTPEDADSPWLSSCGGNSLAGFDEWRQQQQHRAECPSGHCDAADVIIISSDSDSDNEYGEFCDARSWQHTMSPEARLESPEDAMIAKCVAGVEYTSHDTGSCSGLGTSLECRTSTISEDSQAMKVGEGAGGNGQGGGKTVQEYSLSGMKRKAATDEQHLVKCVKLQGRCMVNYHLVRYHTSMKIMKDLKAVNLADFHTQEEWHAFKIQRAQKLMSDWEFRYISYQISRRNVPPPEAETCGYATIPVPAVGHRLQIFYKGQWHTGHVIHYCYSDGEHTVLLEGDLIRTMKFTTDITRELPT